MSYISIFVYSCIHVYMLMEGGEAKKSKQLDLSALFAGSRVEVKLPPKRGRPKVLPSEDVVVAIEAGLTQDEKGLGQRFGECPLRQVLQDTLACQGVVLEAEEEKGIGEEPPCYDFCRKGGLERGGGVWEIRRASKGAGH